MKTALITGASGLLGQLICQSLSQQGYQTIGLKHRKPTKTDVELANVTELKQLSHSKINLVVNLAGAPIAGGLWSESRKQLLLDSRATFTQSLVKSLVQHDISVDHFISGSAIGYYGTGDDFASEDAPQGSDFSAQLCQQWEAAAHEAKVISNTVTVIRTGLVLSKKGGYLQPLKMTAKLGVGSIFGTGEQGQSWIHEADWLAALNFIIETQKSGVFNLVAPKPVSQRELMKSLANSLHRPLIFKVPSFALSLSGEIKTLFVDGQFVLPDRLLTQGFNFKYMTIDQALSDLLS